MMTDILSSLVMSIMIVLFIQMSKRVSAFTIRHALISVIGDEMHTHIYTHTHASGERYYSIYYLIYTVKKHMMDVTLLFKIKKKRKEEMKINYYCLYYCSNVVLFLSSVTKTSEDKRMVTDHCCLTSQVV